MLNFLSIFEVILNKKILANVRNNYYKLINKFLNFLLNLKKFNEPVFLININIIHSYTLPKFTIEMKYFTIICELLLEFINFYFF